jgi:hypothetical protein
MPVSRCDLLPSQDGTVSAGIVNRYTIPFPPGGTLSCYYFVEFGTLFQTPSGVQCQLVPNVSLRSQLEYLRH